MIDSNDKHTSDLLKTDSRQARYRANRQALGFIQKTVWLHRESYERGKLAALGESPDDGDDSYSWWMGHAEVIAASEQNSADIEPEETVLNRTVL